MEVHEKETDGKPSTPTTKDVRNYWEENPLFSLEVTDGYGSEEFFRQLDRIKRDDVEIYTHDYWSFSKYSGKKTLDIGCGPGWYSVSYAKGGANVVSMDLTRKAVELAGKYIKLENLPNAAPLQGDAQVLPFKDDSFDLVASSGVLHHVPDPGATFREVRRVLKKDGEAKITLYYSNIMLRSRFLFMVMKLALKLLGARHHDVNSGSDPVSPEDFVRMYDGKNNPLGIAKTDGEWRKMLEGAGLEVVDSAVHFFPIRFLGSVPLLSTLRSFFDHNFGFLIYYRLQPDK